jgi:hypothetical protein
MLSPWAVANDLGGSQPPIVGGPNSCADCGCHKACQKKMCQVVCETKKVKKSCWCVECAEVGTLLPGHRELFKADGCGQCGATSCEKTCDQGGKKECGAKCAVAPRCDKIRTVKKLVKKEYEVEVPVYKCVAKYTCGDCGGGQAPAAAPKAPAAASAPAVPPAPPAAPLPPVPPKPTKTT